MSNDPNVELHFCGECEYCREMPWRSWGRNEPTFACVRSDDVDDLVLVTQGMEACRDWRES